MQALPLEPSFYTIEPNHTAEVAQVRRAVVESIDRGMPVQYGGEEDGIIFGYQNDGGEWIAYHPMRDGGKKAFVETDWPWGIAVYGLSVRQVPPRKELAASAIEQAVQMAHTAEAGGYHVGVAAWEAYISRLEYLLSADAETRAGDMIGNAWVYECLAGFRACAAVYLRTVAGDFPEDAAARLMKAADLYDKMSGEVLRDEDHCVVTIAPYPWSLAEGETWSDGMLREQIRRLEEALPIEREAIEELEAALAVIGTSA